MRLILEGYQEKIVVSFKLKLVRLGKIWDEDNWGLADPTIFIDKNGKSDPREEVQNRLIALICTNERRLRRRGVEIIPEAHDPDPDIQHILRRGCFEETLLEAYYIAQMNLQNLRANYNFDIKSYEDYRDKMGLPHLNLSDPEQLREFVAGLRDLKMAVRMGGESLTEKERSVWEQERVYDEDLPVEAAVVYGKKDKSSSSVVIAPFNGRRHWHNRITVLPKMLQKTIGRNVVKEAYLDCFPDLDRRDAHQVRQKMSPPIEAKLDAMSEVLLTGTFGHRGEGIPVHTIRGYKYTPREFNIMAGWLMSKFPEVGQAVGGNVNLVFNLQKRCAGWPALQSIPMIKSSPEFFSFDGKSVGCPVVAYLQVVMDTEDLKEFGLQSDGTIEEPVEHNRRRLVEILGDSLPLLEQMGAGLMESLGESALTPSDFKESVLSTESFMSQLAALPRLDDKRSREVCQAADRRLYNRWFADVWD